VGSRARPTQGERRDSAGVPGWIVGQAPRGRGGGVAHNDEGAPCPGAPSVCVTAPGARPARLWWQRSPPPGGDCARMSDALLVSARPSGAGAIHERVPCPSRTMSETALPASVVTGRPPSRGATGPGGAPRRAIRALRPLPARSRRQEGGVASLAPEPTTLLRPAGAPPDAPHEMSRTPHDHAPGAEATSVSRVAAERAR